MGPSSAEPTPEDRFAAVVDELRGEPGVVYGPDEPGSKRAFGATALKVGGKIFAMAVKGDLVVKLPRERVETLVAAGEGTRFDPGHGRPMKEWLVVPPTAGHAWLLLARESLAFVAAAPAAPPRRR